MATKQLLIEQLRGFCSLSNRQLAEDAFDALLSMYNAAFAGVSDKAFLYACDVYKRDGKFFPPRPAELQEIIPKTTEQDDTKAEYRIRTTTQCQRCKRITTCFQEPPIGGTILCRECYSGMTKAQYQKNMDTLSMANAKEGKFAKYDSKTKTVSIVHVKPEGYDPLEDIIGGE